MDVHIGLAFKSSDCLIIVLFSYSMNCKQKAGIPQLDVEYSLPIMLKTINISGLGLSWNFGIFTLCIMRNLRQMFHVSCMQILKIFLCNIFNFVN